MIVNINEIEKITLLLLSKLKESKGNEIELKKDYYWDISEDELYNPYATPKIDMLGQISFDLENVLKLLDEPDDALPYHLKILAIILKALSTELIYFKCSCPEDVHTPKTANHLNLVSLKLAMFGYQISGKMNGEVNGLKV